MDLFELVGKLSIEGTDKAEKELDNITDKANTTGGKFASIVGGIGKGALAVGTAVAGGTAMLVGSVSSAWGELQQSIGGVETLFGEHADMLIEQANRAYRTAGVSANDYMQQATSFSASLLQSLGGDTKKACEYADMAIVDMSDNANKMGSSIESLQNAYQGFAKQNFTMLDNLKLGYGGTQAEMKRLLEDAGRLANKQFDMSSYSDIVEAIHVIQNEMGITNATMMEADKTVTGSIGSMNAAWQNFIAGLGNPDADMKVLVDNLASTFGGMVNNIIPVIENIASVLPVVLESIFNAIGTMLPSLIDTFTNLVLTVISALITNLPTFLNGIAQLLMGLATGIGAMLPTIFGQLGALLEVGYQLLETIINGFVEGVPVALPMMLEFIQQFADSCSEKAPEFITKGFELLSKLIEGIMSALPILIANIPRIISTFADIITNNAPRIILLGAGLVLELIKGLISAIPTLVANIPQICMAIFDVIMAFQWVNLGKNIITFFTNGIKNMLPVVGENAVAVKDTIITFVAELPQRLLDIGQSGIGGLINGITSMIGNLITNCTNLVTRVVNVFKTLPNTMLNVGKDLVRGLWNGVGAMSGWIQNKITEFAKSLIRRMKSALGIKSPSRVAKEEVGIFIPQGVAEGITEDDSPEKAMRDKVGRIMDVVNGTKVAIPTTIDDLFVESPMVKYQMDFNAQFNNLNDGFERLVTLVGNYLPDIASGMDRNIVLDGNNLAVGMSRRIDIELGKIGIAKGRGNV